MTAVEPGSFEPPPPVARAIDTKPKPYLLVVVNGGLALVTPHPRRRRLSPDELCGIDDALARAGDALSVPLPADGSAGLWVAADGTVTPAPDLGAPWLKRLLQDHTAVGCTSRMNASAAG